jgi:hypothetical protein
MGVGLKNPFPTRKILVGTLNASAELLCAKGQQVYSIMESWDHPVKHPNGYQSYRVYSWNPSLGEDWEAAHGDRSWKPFYPLKLRYAYHDVRGSRLWEMSRGKRSRPMCVYAVASTPRFGNPATFELESRIITDLAEATADAGWDLFIKPRPNGKAGEFDSFTKRYPHVTVGSIMDDTEDQPANYYLDDEYNQRRFMEIIEAELVINAFTTFGLDAAAAGMPVLQIDLREATGYEDSQRVFNNHHIKKYLIGIPNVFVVKNESFREKITEYLRSPSNIAASYSDQLVQWLFPSHTMEASLDTLFSDIFGDSSQEAIPGIHVGRPLIHVD